MEDMMDFLKWYNNRDVQPTLEAMKRMVAFYHGIHMDVLKSGYTLPSVATVRIFFTF